MNDKEKPKILAEAIDKTDCYFTDASGRDFCFFCKCSLNKNTVHDLNCPVLLAEEVLKEVPKDKGMLKYLKPIVDELRKKGAIFVPPVISGSEYTYPDNDCPHCKEGSIEPVKGTEPYSEDHLMCNKCDSTFNKDEVLKEHFKRIYVLAQEYKEEFLHAINYEQHNLSSKAENPQFTEEWFNNIMIDCSICEYMTPHNYLLLINKMKEKGYIISSKPEESFSKANIEKKPMKLYELKHQINILISQGYSNVPVYFDTEAKTFDCHVVPIGSINIVPKEAVGEDHIVLYEYIEKPEEPIIVHNVMSYKGKNYLKQLSLQWDSCKFCSFNEDCPLIDMACEDNFIWKSFDDIKITDELACMRKDIGDIYLYNIQENKIDKLTYVEDGRKSYVHTIGWRSTNDNMRLATAEEIQKYLEDKK